MTRGFTFTAVLAATLAVMAGCTTQNSEAPALTGPSGFATSTANTPVASFQINPNPVDLSVAHQVTFDASGSCGVALSASGSCQSPPVSFQFAFSDGTTASGPVVVRPISDDSIGTISAMLVVTNSNGAASSTTKSAQVLRSQPPKADFAFVPNSLVLTAPGAATVVFTDTSTTVSPRSVRQLEWNFLDGRPADTTPTVAHQFLADQLGPNTFTVVLKVTDDLGQVATAVKSVIITVTPPATPPTSGGTKAAAVVH
jgi:hypothetical protein